MDRRQLNKIYEKLDEKAREISKLLDCSYAYYNGHYNRNESDNYEIEYFPIPVITIKGVCDIEIGLDQISVTAKLSKKDALSYDYGKVKAFNFEAYGENNYLDDFYIAGSTIDGMIKKIEKSSESNIFFSFAFPYEMDSDDLCKFVKFIKSEGFFY